MIGFSLENSSSNNALEELEMEKPGGWKTMRLPLL